MAIAGLSLLDWRFLEKDEARLVLGKLMRASDEDLERAFSALWEATGGVMPSDDVAGLARYMVERLGLPMVCVRVDLTSGNQERRW